jgi:asparagine synthase (glutamine-hydrolysing)
MNFGGYLYFHKAPNAREFHENVRKLGNCIYDCLRANKSLAAWELKDVSVLDKEFMDVAMRINPQDKMINKEHPMEKWVVQALKICCQV